MEAHLFFADLDEADNRGSALLEFELPRDEREAADRYRFPRDARRFLAGRVFLRRTLARLLGTHPSRFRFEAGPHGKPEIAFPAGTSLAFNLSHAGGSALLAVAWRRRIGVDLEPWNAAPDADVLAPRVLAFAELGEFRILDPDRRIRFFLQRWTAKEALLKAAGVGLGADPSRISLAADGGSGFLGDAGSLGLFRVQAVDELPGFVAALATDAATPLGAVHVEIERTTYSGFHNPIVFPSGSANQAKVPRGGTGTGGTSVRPPSDSAFASAAPMSSTST